MRALSRTALIGAASAALTLGAGIPVGAASAADAATPGWRQVKVFDCQGANGLWITANGPRNAWASGFCGPTLAHWNGQSWREVSLPSRFGGFETDPAIATLSGSYVVDVRRDVRRAPGKLRVAEEQQPVAHIQ